MKKRVITEKEKKEMKENLEESELLDPWFHSIPEKERAEKWFWCMHCEQCFQGKEAIAYLNDGKTLFSCPNFWDKERGRCTGTPIDWHSWESVRKQEKDNFGIELPLIPEKGKDYLMYPS